MRKLTLLSVLVLGVLLMNSAWAGLYKFKSSPHLPIMSSQTTTDRIYVSTNVNMINVRIGFHTKTVYDRTLRVTLTSPTGQQVRLLNEQSSYYQYPAPYGSWGSERSYVLFQDGGATDVMSDGKQPNDRPVSPATSFAVLNGKNAMGWWTLSITDYRGYYSIDPYQNGYLEDWVILFNSTIKEPEVPIWTQTRVASQLIGQMNGHISVIPNQNAAGELCTSGGLPNVSPGKNGDAFPFIIQNTGYPTLKIGDALPGFTTGGRFKINLTIQTNLPSPSPVSAAFTNDISVFFGKSPSFTSPLQAPPSPAKDTGVASGWATGGAPVSYLLPTAAAQSAAGGVRLTACNNKQAVPWNIPFNDEGGYQDAGFDDFALSSIETADVCSFGDGVCGDYKPEEKLSLLNGQLLEGLYYVTVYDTYGEKWWSIPAPKPAEYPLTFGHIRVTGITITYLAGGGQAPNLEMHEGIAGPLLGVPIPGAITGSLLGYLPDVVSTIPPYSIHAKEQDPVMIFWGTQKMGPKSAIGWERIQARQGTTYIDVANDGPYAYPSSLDATPTVAGLSVNADLAILPTGSYWLRSTLSQQRYDDDNTDNQYESAGQLVISPTTMAYYGVQNPYWNQYQQPSQGGYGQFAQYPMQPQGSSGAGVGVAYTLFKYPVTNVTSVDFRFDASYVAGFGLLRTPLRISVWRCANGYTGAPVGPPVALSPTMQTNEFHFGNWHTFPLYGVSNGAIDMNSPAPGLAPGTYVVMLDNQASSQIVLFPWTYGMMPFITDRHGSWAFNDKFGPLGTLTALGTRMMYTSSAGTSAPSSGMSGTPNSFGNFTWPMRFNMTTQNDFAINYVSINGVNGTESVSITNAPFQPNISVTANSTQGGNNKDFNVRLEIFSGSNSVYMSDVMYGSSGSPSYPGINGYQTVSVPMARWNPATAGLYHVKAWFSRNPDDQNAVNDQIEYDLYVSPTRAILATGQGVTPTDVSATVEALKQKGISVEVVTSSNLKVADTKGADIYVIGALEASAKDVITTAIANGSNVAFVYDTTEKIGKLLRNVDYVFDIERPAANYDKMDATYKVEPSADETVKAPTNVPTFNSKEELISYVKSHQTGLEDVVNDVPQKPADPTKIAELIPVEKSCPYGKMTYLGMKFDNLGIVYALPESRKAKNITAEAATPTGFTLDQNYPNPFNPSTVIGYSLPQTSIVTLRVLDMLGREVITLASGTQEAGRYIVSWTGQNQVGEHVASGNYFYRLDATPVDGSQPFSSIKKLTMAK